LTKLQLIIDGDVFLTHGVYIYIYIYICNCHSLVNKGVCVCVCVICPRAWDNEPTSVLRSQMTTAITRVLRQIS